MIWIVVLGVFILLTIVYFTGPTPAPFDLPTQLPSVPADLPALEKFIQDREKKIPYLRPDNEARIVWAEGKRHQRTPICLVYIHGFSASQGEGYPIHVNFARRYGCNLFLSRLQAHGTDPDEPLLDLTPDELMASAWEAVAIGQQLGEKVIVMATSTGCTLSLFIASHLPSLAGLICYSPNVELYTSAAFLMTQPWGIWILRAVFKGKYRVFSGPKDDNPYWNQMYRLEALVTLKALLNASMKKEVFERINQPIFMGYYFKNDKEKDQNVSIPRMMEMFDQLSTPPELKRKVNFPKAGNHGIPNIYYSNDVEGVMRETFLFAEEILGLEIVDENRVDGFTVDGMWASE